MKKIFIFVFFLNMPLMCFSDGIFSTGSFSYDWNTNSFVSSLSAGYEWKMLYAEAEQKTYMEKAELYMFSPFKAEYFARVGVEYKFIYFEYEHLCVHGIDKYNPEGGHGRFTIGFDTRNNEKDKNP